MPGDDASPSTSYTLTASPGGAQATVSGNPPATTAQLSGLVEGQSYSVAVTATNSVETSAPSVPVEVGRDHRRLPRLDH